LTGGLKVSGDAATVARLARVRQSLFAAVKMAVTSQTIALRTRVQEKLDGEVLQMRSGRLHDSVTATIDTDGDVVSGDVSVAGVRYAAIQEYGGTVHVPEIVPERASALAFAIKGELIFAARARAHDVTIPERSYLRSSLAENSDAIAAALRDAVAAAANGA
jgi:phage gpG-like protein